ncbi:MAG: exo-alpha-sialidase, partial [Chloroflexi bacterium]|nr:exo-alpha-sialidase [Chloroflexota bacterium]
RSLGGDEPFNGWYISSIDSHDGGQTWSELAPEINLFPYWTEMYGASNPHPVSDGRYMFAIMGTIGRDKEWRSGVTFTDAQGQNYTPPIIIAAAPDRNFSDTDIVRLPDGRFLAVIREHITRQAFLSHSADEGQSWTPVRPTGFKGSNIKLLRLRSGAILCAYRDEDPARRGVSCSISSDGGFSWQFSGQLYVADPSVPHRPGDLCGYPDLIYTRPNEIAAVVHTYPDANGSVHLQFLQLRDLSA